MSFEVILQLPPDQQYRPLLDRYFELDRIMDGTAEQAQIARYLLTGLKRQSDDFVREFPNLARAFELFRGPAEAA